MGDNTAIEWSDATWNPIRGCTLVSAGCTNCYAMRQAHRFSGVGQPYEGLTRLSSKGPVWTGKIRVVEEHLEDPLRWHRPRRIFVNSMSDLFHESLSDESIDRIFAVMGACEDAERGHIFQVLTKRAERMCEYVRKRGYDAFNSRRLSTEQWPARNIWFGVSSENQQTADSRIPYLLKTPANIRWISYEPALGPIDFAAYLQYDPIYEKQTKRGVCIPSDIERRLGDRLGREDMESPQEGMGSLAKESGQSPLQESQSGARQRRILSGTNNDRSQESLCGGITGDMETLLWANPGGADSQSQGREQEERSSEQLRTSNSLGTVDSCDPSSWNASCRESGGRKESRLQDFGVASTRNKETATVRRKIDSDSSRFRYILSDSIEDRTGGQAFCNWIVCGGESGPGARPFDLQWARDIITQCSSTGTACFVKQLGALPCEGYHPEDDLIRSIKLRDKKGGDWLEWPEDLRVREYPE